MSQQDELCPTHKIKRQAPDCVRCDGEGAIEVDDDDFLFPQMRIERCYSCGGSGRAPWKECELCAEDGREDAYWEDG